MSEGYKKKDIQRAVKPDSVALSSKELDATTTSDKIELGFAAEKMTVVTTGNLVAQVTPKIGSANSGSAVGASTTVASSTPANMFASVEISRTSGTGKLIILAK